MANRNFKVLDSDIHIIEPPDLWQRYIDPACRDRAPYGLPELRMAPSDYFKRQCFVSVECDEASVKYVLDAIGDDRLVFSTDFPHGDSKFPRAVESFFQLSIPEEGKRKILWDNCAAYYGLPA